MQQPLLDEVGVFVRVVEAGSLQAAARTLRVPASTVSRALTRLETALRTPLFHRGGRSLVLSEAGRSFFKQAAPHVRGLLEAVTTVGEGTEQPRGPLRVSAPPVSTCPSTHTVTTRGPRTVSPPTSATPVRAASA